MKKIICLIITVCLMFTLLMPNVAFAADTQKQTEWQDIVLSDKEFEETLSNNPNNSIMPLSSTLIIDHQISITKTGSSIIITGITYCAADVIKSGFTKVTVQRRKNSSASWDNYKKYGSLYNDTNRYKLSKTLSVDSAYQYRVICTHYAKKSILNTQKIDNTSNTLTF